LGQRYLDCLGNRPLTFGNKMAQNINLGKIEYKWRGDYSTSTIYTAKDLVRNNNTIWICIANSTNNLPSSTSDYWDEFFTGLSQAEDTGALTFMGANSVQVLKPVPIMRWYFERYSSAQDTVSVGKIDWDKVNMKPYHDAHMLTKGSTQEITEKSSKGLHVWETELGEISQRIGSSPRAANTRPHWIRPEVKLGNSPTHEVGSGVVSPGTAGNVSYTDYVNSSESGEHAIQANYSDKFVRTDVGQLTNSGRHTGGDGHGSSTYVNHGYGSVEFADQQIYNTVTGTTTTSYTDGVSTGTSDGENLSDDHVHSIVSGDNSTMEGTSTSAAAQSGESTQSSQY